MASWLTGSHCALPLHCSKRVEPENAQQSIIFGAFVRHPSDLQTCRIARVCHCVFYYEFWRRFQQTGVPRKLGKGGGACSSETMETKLGHCTNFVLFFLYKCAYISISKMLRDPPLMWPYYLFHCCPLIGFFSRASISRDPFYDMLATRKRRIANKKWGGTIFSSLHRLHLSLLAFTTDMTVSLPRTEFERCFHPWTVHESVCTCCGDMRGTAELQETQMYGLDSCMEQHMNN